MGGGNGYYGNPHSRSTPSNSNEQEEGIVQYPNQNGSYPAQGGYMGAEVHSPQRVPPELPSNYYQSLRSGGLGNPASQTPHYQPPHSLYPHLGSQSIINEIMSPHGDDFLENNCQTCLIPKYILEVIKSIYPEQILPIFISPKQLYYIHLQNMSSYDPGRKSPLLQPSSTELIPG